MNRYNNEWLQAPLRSLSVCSDASIPIWGPVNIIARHSRYALSLSHYGFENRNSQHLSFTHAWGPRHRWHTFRTSSPSFASHLIEDLILSRDCAKVALYLSVFFPLKNSWVLIKSSSVVNPRKVTLIILYATRQSSLPLSHALDIPTYSEVVPESLDKL
jgi:hypothetical protein